MYPETVVPLRDPRLDLHMDRSLGGHAGVGHGIGWWSTVCTLVDIGTGLESVHGDPLVQGHGVGRGAGQPGAEPGHTAPESPRLHPH